MNTQTKAYIIENGEYIATVKTNQKNGSEVEFSNQSSAESIDTSRSKNLVNSRNAKISRAKKWDEFLKFKHEVYADEINDGEFLIY